jgi:hypothetical protein
MALTTHAEIRAEIADHLEQLQDMREPEDLLQELADSNTPIYYSDIIQEWTELPTEFSDQWWERSVWAENETITSLMQIDLYLYYQGEFIAAWEEIKEEQETD